MTLPLWKTFWKQLHWHRILTWKNLRKKCILSPHDLSTLRNFEMRKMWLREELVFFLLELSQGNHLGTIIMTLIIMSTMGNFLLLLFSGGGINDKESACNAGDLGLIPGSGRSTGEENANPLQYSCLKNPMDRGAWWATVHGVTKVGHNWATNTHYKILHIYSHICLFTHTYIHTYIHII